MFDTVHREYFFDNALKYSIISDQKFAECERAFSGIEIESFAEQAGATMRRAELYWAAYCGRTHPIHVAKKIYHRPPRFVY
jgi:hypothetical protein